MAWCLCFGSLPSLPSCLLVPFGFAGFCGVLTIFCASLLGNTRDSVLTFFGCQGMGQCAGELATMDDWEAHLTTVFPEVRLKRYIEMRGADGGPWNMICALPALWVGLIYNKEVQAKCTQLISGWSQEDRDYLRAEV